jgi:dTDP-4-amino-4,6-dideoxygalactose transaminase
MPIVHLHGRPVFVDVIYETHNLDPSKIERAITPRTRAIVVVHCNGHPADMDLILEIARKRSLSVIEDCAHLQGALYRGRPCGAFGDVACFSLRSYKNVPGGEGGVLVTNRPSFYERAMLCGQHPLRLEQCLEDPSLRLHISTGGLGWNHRIHPVAATLALESLSKLDEWLHLRQESAKYLAEAMQDIPGFRHSFVAPGVTHAFYCHVAYLDRAELAGVSLERCVEALRAEGMDASRFGEPVYRAHAFAGGGEIFGKGCPLRCPRGRGSIAYDAACYPESERAVATQFRFGTCGFPFRDTAILDEYVEAFRKVSQHAEELL